MEKKMKELKIATMQAEQPPRGKYIWTEVLAFPKLGEYLNLHNLKTEQTQNEICKKLTLKLPYTPASKAKDRQKEQLTL